MLVSAIYIVVYITKPIINTPDITPIKRRLCQTIVENRMVNYSPTCFNAVYGYCHSKNGSVTGKEITVKVS